MIATSPLKQGVVFFWRFLSTVLAFARFAVFLRVEFCQHVLETSPFTSDDTGMIVNHPLAQAILRYILYRCLGAIRAYFLSLRYFLPALLSQNMCCKTSPFHLLSHGDDCEPSPNARHFGVYSVSYRLLSAFAAFCSFCAAFFPVYVVKILVCVGTLPHFFTHQHTGMIASHLRKQVILRYILRSISVLKCSSRFCSVLCFLLLVLQYASCTYVGRFAKLR